MSRNRPLRHAFLQVALHELDQDGTAAHLRPAEAHQESGDLLVARRRLDDKAQAGRHALRRVLDAHDFRLGHADHFVGQF